MSDAGMGFGKLDSSMFDSIAHTQGGMPHLIQYLWSLYVEYLNEVIETRTEAGQATVTLGEAIKRTPATRFIAFAEDFLAANRVVENFFVDSNHGIKLSNNDSMVICPGTGIQGTMQDSGAVPIMEGKSNPYTRGMMNSGNAYGI